MNPKRMTIYCDIDFVPRVGSNTCPVSIHKWDLAAQLGVRAPLKSSTQRSYGCGFNGRSCGLDLDRNLPFLNGHY